MSLFDTVTPAAPDADGMTPDEKRQFETMRAHRMLGLLIQRIPADVHMYELTMRHDGISAMPHKSGTDDEQRILIRRLAALLDGFEYTDRPHDSSRDRVAAVGEIGGVRVELWSLVDQCQCHCHGGA